MALKLLAIRKRETGTEYSVYDDVKEREHLFWRHGNFSEDKVEVLTWATPLVTSKLQAEADELAAEALAVTEADQLTDEFIAKIKTNKGKGDIKASLIELAKKLKR